MTGDVVPIPLRTGGRGCVTRSPFAQPVRVRLDVVSEVLEVDGHHGPAWLIDRLRCYGKQRRDVLADYQRGTIRSGPRAGEPYAPPTIAGLLSHLNTLEQGFAEYAVALRRLEPGERTERAIAGVRQQYALDPEPAA